MWFTDGQGQVQLTGAGFFLLLFLVVFLVFSLIETIRKIFWYRKEYKRLRAEVDWLEQDFEKELPIALEKYYQQRKRWEKNQGFY